MGTTVVLRDMLCGRWGDVVGRMGKVVSTVEGLVRDRWLGRRMLPRVGPSKSHKVRLVDGRNQVSGCDPARWELLTLLELSTDALLICHHDAQLLLVRRSYQKVLSSDLTSAAPHLSTARNHT